MHTYIIRTPTTTPLGTTLPHPGDKRCTNALQASTRHHNQFGFGTGLATERIDLVERDMGMDERNTGRRNAMGADAPTTEEDGRSTSYRLPRCCR